MEPLITGPLAAALEAGRAHFNARFAQARCTMPGLDGGAFARHLHERVTPVVASVDAVAPAQTGAVAELLFDISLDLIGKEYPGRFPDFPEHWSRVLSALPRHLAQDPRRFAGSVTNALSNLALTASARPGEWAEALIRLGPSCPDVTELLEAGKVCAWKAGLAQFRSGALDACLRLSPKTATAALGLPGPATRPAVEEAVKQLRADPWLDPAHFGKQAAPPRGLALVRTVGSFRGFGGPFLRPPRVGSARGQLFVTDGEGCWLLVADLFGATLHRSHTEFPEKQRKAPFTIHREGVVTVGQQTRTFEELRRHSSFAGTLTTLAVTIPLSHQVFLIGLREQGPEDSAGPPPTPREGTP
jgi:hypothetical protein